MLDERFRQGPAHHEDAVVFQEHDALVAEMLDQPLALLRTHRHPLEIMIGDPADEVARIEIRRAQAALKRADRHAGGGVGVHDAVRIGQMPVEQRVLDKPRLVDAVRAVVELVAVDVDLDEAGGGHLAEMQPERVDQERARLPRHVDGDMVVDHLRPAEHVEHAVAGGEFGPRLPLFVTDPGTGLDGGGHDALLCVLPVTIAFLDGCGNLGDCQRADDAANTGGKARGALNRDPCRANIVHRSECGGRPRPRL